jgi:hypothetical protein
LELPALPEEVYADSFLRLKHVASGCVIDVSAWCEAFAGVCGAVGGGWWVVGGGWWMWVQMLVRHSNVLGW